LSANAVIYYQQSTRKLQQELHSQPRKNLLRIPRCVLPSFQSSGRLTAIATIIGLVAATGTTLSFLPQAMRIIKTKHTKDLSLAMYLIFTTGVFLWLIYGILIKDLPVIIANAITLLFTSTILIFKIKYN